MWIQKTWPTPRTSIIVSGGQLERVEPGGRTDRRTRVDPPGHPYAGEMTPSLRRGLLAYPVAMVVFVAVDLVWLTAVATDLYDAQLGPLLADPVRPLPAVAFYLLFVAGIVHFVVLPALDRDSVRWAAGSGAFFGLVTYATWDLTSLSVLEGFPAALVPVDLAWGTVLAAVVSTVTTIVVRRFGVSEPT